MNVSFIKSAAKLNQFPVSDLPEICFSGRSNVGKSSLLNLLTGRKSLAKIGKTPGKTRLVNFFNIDDKYIFTDLPGYGYANVSKAERASWGSLIEGYIYKRNNLKLAIQLLDSRRIPNESDMQMIDFFNCIKLDTLIVLTKCDKLSNNQLANQIKAISEKLAIPKEKIIQTTIRKSSSKDKILEYINEHY